jgi:hypothetical protein
MRPPDPDTEADAGDVWLERAALAREHGPLGHHTHFGGIDQARPPVPEEAADRVRREAEWLRARGVRARFWCGGGWYTTPVIAGVLARYGYVDCTATAFPLPYLADGEPHLRLPAPCWLRLPDGGRLLELPATHSLGMAGRLALSPRRIAGDVVHVYFHDWDLMDRRRALVLRAVLAALGRRCRPSDLDGLADEVERDASELPLPSGVT